MTKYDKTLVESITPEYIYSKYAVISYLCISVRFCAHLLTNGVSACPCVCMGGVACPNSNRTSLSSSMGTSKDATQYWKSSCGHLGQMAGSSWFHTIQQFHLREKGRSVCQVFCQTHKVDIWSTDFAAGTWERFDARNRWLAETPTATHDWMVSKAQKYHKGRRNLLHTVDGRWNQTLAVLLSTPAPPNFNVVFGLRAWHRWTKKSNPEHRGS